MNLISILLSTYNSEKYLNEQIDSILKQSVTNWKLFLRDDGSTDNTLNIINQYCEKNKNKIELLIDNKGNLGVDKSFMYMLSEVESDYYMFCDHDDIWLPYKIEKTMEKMKATESDIINKPVLIFTDLTVVDENLKIISSSMWRYSKTNPEYSKNIYYLSVSSTVTGCTMLMNKMVKEFTLPYPEEALMHDWWIALNVAYHGVVDYIDESTILYRQHDNNRIGAEKTNKKHYLNKFFKLKKVINENVKVIKMLNKCRFKINHVLRLIIKVRIIFKKSFIYG